MTLYRKARDGYKYSLTALGLEVNHVRAKYNSTHRLYKQYQHTAPKSWYDKGYIVEVEEIGENGSKECMQTD